MKEYVLNGSADPGSIDRRVAFLTELYDKAAEKGHHLDNMRQRNVNYALIIFAGFFTFGTRIPAGSYAVFVSAGLLGVMIVFCVLDRRLHRFTHGWRETKTMFMEKINTVINNPEADASYVTYLGNAENSAELIALQPMIVYLLVGGGIVQMAHSLISALRAAQG